MQSSAIPSLISVVTVLEMICYHAVRLGLFDLDWDDVIICLLISPNKNKIKFFFLKIKT